MVEIRPKDINEVIEASVLYLSGDDPKTQVAPLFLGPPGIGKTEVAEEIARRLGIENVIILNASQTSGTDLVFPVVMGEKGQEYVDLRTVNFDNSLVVIDELTNARKDLQSFLLSLVLNHRIGDRRFVGMKIIATGNNATDSVLAQDLPRPLIERFAVINFPVPTTEEWSSYMISLKASGIPVFEPYLTFVRALDPAMFIDESGYGVASGNMQRPSPRSHTRAAIILGRRYKELKEVIEDINFAKNRVGEIVGPAVAAQFVAYMNDARDFKSWEDFEREGKIDTPGQLFSILYSLAAKARPSKNQIYQIFFSEENATYEDKQRFAHDVAERLAEPLEKILGAVNQNPKLHRFRLQIIPTIIGPEWINTAYGSAVKDAVNSVMFAKRMPNYMELVKERKEFIQSKRG